MSLAVKARVAGDRRRRSDFGSACRVLAADRFQGFNTKDAKFAKHTKGERRAPDNHPNHGDYPGAKRPFVFFESFASFVFPLDRRSERRLPR